MLLTISDAASQTNENKTVSRSTYFIVLELLAYHVVFVAIEYILLT